LYTCILAYLSGIRAFLFLLYYVVFYVLMLLISSNRSSILNELYEIFYYNYFLYPNLHVGVISATTL
ncbi:MAG: hypothetical protein WB988_05290, partial [Candidatus Nitrosopolaris sp.]